ncbi:MAG: hypothetical protein ACLGI6_08245 [Gammaproteobacteria bacterium]
MKPLPCMASIALSVMLLALAGCKFITAPLDEDGLRQWAAAYANIAAVSGRVNEQKKSEARTDVMLCASCRETLGTAVKKAGYKDLASFVLVDARIKVAVLHHLHSEMTQLLHELSAGMNDTPDCAKPLTSLDNIEPGQVICRIVAAKIGHMESASKKTDFVTGMLTTDADVAFVVAHYAAIERAESDPRLIDEYRMHWPPEVMNGPNARREQACQRIARGLGDGVDAKQCPDGRDARPDALRRHASAPS